VTAPSLRDQAAAAEPAVIIVIIINDIYKAQTSPRQQMRQVSRLHARPGPPAVPVQHAATRSWPACCSQAS